jgi:hypothetical protein
VAFFILAISSSARRVRDFLMDLFADLRIGKVLVQLSVG